jgi:hypothetical protein
MHIVRRMRLVKGRCRRAAFHQRDAGWAESSKHMAWARDMAEAMRPHSSDAYLLNFLSEEDPDTIKAAFGANYPRLAQVKKKYDPTNFFSINQNVQPAL